MNKIKILFTKDPSLTEKIRIFTNYFRYCEVFVVVGVIISFNILFILICVFGKKFNLETKTI